MEPASGFEPLNLNVDEAYDYISPGRTSGKQWRRNSCEGINLLLTSLLYIVAPLKIQPTLNLKS